MEGAEKLQPFEFNIDYNPDTLSNPVPSINVELGIVQLIGDINNNPLHFLILSEAERLLRKPVMELMTPDDIQFYEAHGEFNYRNSYITKDPYQVFGIIATGYALAKDLRCLEKAKQSMIDLQARLNQNPLYRVAKINDIPIKFRIFSYKECIEDTDICFHVFPELDFPDQFDDEMKTYILASANLNN